MESYKLQSTDEMGNQIKERFFLDKDKALIEFDKEIEKYQKNGHLASKQDVLNHDMGSEPISINDNPPDSIKSAMACLWYKTSYEYDEWDVTVENLTLQKIEIEE